MTDGEGRRPGDFQLQREEKPLTACPFCPGEERRTPPELFALRPDGSRPNTPGWQVRVTPNKLPTFGLESGEEQRAEGLYDVRHGVGAHEVVIESPSHNLHPAAFGSSGWSAIFQAWRARLLDLRRDFRFRSIMVFKNHGLEAGALIQHSHSQIMAVPVMPPRLAIELAASREHFLRKERCLHCDLLAQERKGEGVVSSAAFLCYAPFAARHPFEMRIAPLRHGHDFAAISDPECRQLGTALSDLLQRMRRVLRDPPFNLLLVTAPPSHPPPGKPDQWASLSHDFHWYLEIVPRLQRQAGFDQATGFFLNPVAPATAARTLRECQADA